MVEPVLAEDGSTYDRAEIEQWLQTHATNLVIAELMHRSIIFFH